MMPAGSAVIPFLVMQYERNAMEKPQACLRKIQATGFLNFN